MAPAADPLEAFRAEARAWLEENFAAWKASEGVADPGALGQKLSLEQQRSWQRWMAERGWGAPAWPPAYGGRGLGPLEAMVWGEEKARVGANIPFDLVGFGMSGPTIVAHGTDEQKARYLPALLRGDEIWCQLFSEPGAGSDLASLSTRAIRDGPEWVVTGQKVWSSGAHQADWGILLARHDFDVPKHRGLIYLLCDMHSPGVTVRPLKQIDGSAHFNEVFLDEVRIPDGQRLGAPGQGWAIAMTTLMNERMSLGTAAGGFSFPFDKLVALAGRSAVGSADRLVRQDLARIYTHNRLLEFLNERIVSKLRAGQIPDAEGSIMKLALAALTSESGAFGLRLLGPAGTLEGDDGPQMAFLLGPAMHIGGGTDEVQKNVIGERILGLPREPRPDKEMPFSQTKF